MYLLIGAPPGRTWVVVVVAEGVAAAESAPGVFAAESEAMILSFSGLRGGCDCGCDDGGWFWGGKGVVVVEVVDCVGGLG